MNNDKWDNALRQIIQDYKDGSGDEPLDGDSAEALGRILLAKINLMEGNITEEEFFEMDLSRTAIETDRLLKESEEGTRQEYFHLLSISRDSLRDIFNDEEEEDVKREINNLTDNEMTEIQNTMMNTCMPDVFVEILKETVSQLISGKQKKEIK